MALVPDSGATISVASKDVAEHLNLKIDKSRKVKLWDIQGNKMTVVGVAPVWIKAPGGPTKQLYVAVTSAITSQFQISWKDQVKMHILPADYPNVIPRTKRK